MKLSHISDQALLQQTLLLVKREKEILGEILLHLEEVQRRRLFCDLGYGSLFQYCVKQLGYSEDQAYRRINALKISKQIPEVKEQIASGELSLSALSVATSLFQSDQKVDRKEVLAALRNKSKREAEKIVRTFSSKLPEVRKELKLSLTLAQEEKFNEVKARLAHCNLSDAEILERLCDLFLAPGPGTKAKTKSKSKSRNNHGADSAQKTTENPALRPAPPRNSALQSVLSARKISAPLKRQIFQQSHHQCSQCQSKFALEIDHKIPRALGGTNHLNNLRLVCRNCNQRAAIKILGAKKMEKYLEGR